jgi:hypothetical protein
MVTREQPLHFMESFAAVQPERLDVAITGFKTFMRQTV